MKKDFLSILDLSAREILAVLNLAGKLKQELRSKGSNDPLLANKTLVMLFEKTSLRTRLSFEVGMTQLGGHAVFLTRNHDSVGNTEPISDVAKMISVMGDIVMARTYKHETILDLAVNSCVPVINALSDLEHPCQILADLFTIMEKKKMLKGLNLAFVGDGENNVVHSMVLASSLFGINFSVAAPKNYQMNKEIVSKADRIAKETGSTIIETDNPCEAIEGADVVYTDTWISKGDEVEEKERLKVFKPYQVTEDLMKMAKPDAIFMHNMPAYRGNEVVTDVIDGPQSVIIQQAENRLHVQKALMIFLLKHYEN